jgi:hypothetical protein
MNRIKTLRQLLMAIGLGTLVACGGDQLAGIGGTGITASGTITGFGSIFVNGVEYETGSAGITLDDSAAGENDLRLGMVVTVTGTLNADGITGTATTVSFDDEVQGPVETVPQDPTGDGTQLEFTVMGISVLADSAATVFDDGVTFTSLAQGDFIEVSGFFDQNDVLHATRIEGQAGNEVELRGLATNVSGSTFELDGFTVDTGTHPADMSEVPGGVVTDGMPVEVKGTLSGNTIIATRVEQEDDLIGDDIGKASIEGIVAGYTPGNNSFTVAGQPVEISPTTDFEPTTLVLDNGLEVEVEGPIVGGTLQAQEVEARGGDVELEATVLDASPANPSQCGVTAVTDGTITLQYFNGTVDVQIDSQTSLRDDFGGLPSYTICDVASGDFLEIRASIDGSSNIIANEVRRDDISDDIVQGPADAGSCNNISISVFGVSFSFNSATQFEDENEQAYPNATAFCNAVNSRGLFVKVQDNATVNNGVIIVPADGIADEAELED